MSDLVVDTLVWLAWLVLWLPLSLWVIAFIPVVNVVVGAGALYCAMGFARFCGSSHWLARNTGLVLLASCAVCSASVGVFAWRRGEYELHQLMSLSVLHDELVSRSDAGGVQPPHLRVPAWMLADERARHELAALQLLAVRYDEAVPRSEIESDSDVGNGEVESVHSRMNRMVLARRRAASPASHGDLEAWSAELALRLADLDSALSACPVYPLGSDRPTMALQELHDTLDRAREHEHPLERFGLLTAVDEALSKLADVLSGTREMPVINGEARGALPPPGTLIRFCVRANPIPVTATLFSGTDGSAEFELVTKPGQLHIFARLVGPDGDVWRGFVRAGEKILTSLPPGDYVLRYAAGTHWYGLQYLFGPGTQFAEADTVIDLRARHRVTISLVRRSGGNLSEVALDANDF